MAKNILVGDIGSTKSVWRKNFGAQTEIALGGFNPLVHPPDEGERLFVGLANQMERSHPDFIYYFGTGVIDDTVRSVIADHVKKYFPDAVLRVESDLLGACIAACGDQPGTVAILGTGSHCAVFDGKQIVRQAQSLGYILGDEGGGCDIGKALIRSFFYNAMPTHIRDYMQQNKITGGRAAFLHELYHSPMPNQYLADFAGVADVFREDEWIQALLGDRFAAFINTHVKPLIPEGPIHVVGSIGFIFSRLLQQELDKAGLSMGELIRDPIKRIFDAETNYEHTT